MENAIKKTAADFICQKQYRTDYAFVTFRLDDICESMNFEKFHALREVFEKHNIKPLLGVVPKNQDNMLRVSPPYEKFYELMRSFKDNGWMIAQHGFTHVYETNQSGFFKFNRFSEFAGLHYEIQINKILEGQKILERHGLSTDIFMAPAHTMDENTVKALVARGFHYVSDGCATHSYERGGLKFIPCYHPSPVLPRKGLITVMFHPNNVTEQQIRSLDNFLTTYKKSCISFSEAMGLPTIPLSRAHWQEQKYFLLLNKIKPFIRYFCRRGSRFFKKDDKKNDTKTIKSSK